MSGITPPAAAAKEWRRCVISSNTGTRLLTVPVLHDDKGIVSEHGNWRSAHLQALMSEYGRCAYYPHLAPQIEAVIGRGETRLSVINGRLHDMVMTTVAPADTLQRVADIMHRDPAHWHQLHIEKSGGEREEISVIDVLMRRGPEAIFTLIDTLNI